MSDTATSTSITDLYNHAPPPAVIAVEGLMHFGSLVALIGAPGLGKSMLLADLAVALSSGLPWLNHTTGGPAPVLIVPAEGRLRSWIERIYAATFRMGATTVPLPITIHHHELPGGVQYVRPLDLMGEDKGNLFTTIIRDRPAAILFDPFVDLYSGDENKVADVKAMLNILRIIAAQTGALVVFAHHTRKPPSGADEGEPSPHDARGSSAVLGAVDTMIQLSRIAGGAVLVTATKQRDLPLPREPIAAFRIEGAQYGPVLAQVDVETARRAAEAQKADVAAHKRMGAAEIGILAALQRMGGAAIRSQVANSSGVRAQDARAAIDRLLASGAIQAWDGQKIDDGGKPRTCQWIGLPSLVLPSTAGAAHAPAGSNGVSSPPQPAGEEL